MGEHNLPKIQLSIRLEQNGMISVQGPIDDKILCLGLLEFAKQIVFGHKKQEQSIIVPDLKIPDLKGN